MECWRFLDDLTERYPFVLILSQQQIFLLSLFFKCFLFLQSLLFRQIGLARFGSFQRFCTTFIRFARFLVANFLQHSVYFDALAFHNANGTGFVVVLYLHTKFHPKLCLGFASFLQLRGTIQKRLFRLGRSLFQHRVTDL
uniref:Uncharacterized protein n=1 Tax=Anopheles farauti TaxID=69004 RepID=A0A182QCK0_9DIPT